MTSAPGNKLQCSVGIRETAPNLSVTHPLLKLNSTEAHWPHKACLLRTLSSTYQLHLWRTEMSNIRFFFFSINKHWLLQSSSISMNVKCSPTTKGLQPILQSSYFHHEGRALPPLWRHSLPSGSKSLPEHRPFSINSILTILGGGGFPNKQCQMTGVRTKSWAHITLAPNPIQLCWRIFAHLPLLRVLHSIQANSEEHHPWCRKAAIVSNLLLGLGPARRNANPCTTHTEVSNSRKPPCCNHHRHQKFLRSLKTGLKVQLTGCQQASYRISKGAEHRVHPETQKAKPRCKSLPPSHAQVADTLLRHSDLCTWDPWASLARAYSSANSLLRLNLEIPVKGHVLLWMVGCSKENQVPVV